MSYLLLGKTLESSNLCTKSRGVTLVELLTVISIIGVLTVGAFPTLLKP